MAGKNTIKGLTIEIGGDTTQLGKALEDVNKKSRDLSTELGDINRLLKMDPGNTELLAQKQKVLADAIRNTGEKLDKLKAAEAQVQEQFARGEVSEDQVRALQREIIVTTSKMNGYEKAAKETADALDQLGNDSGDVVDGAKDVDRSADRAADSLDDFSDSANKAGDAGSGLGAKLGDAAKVGLAAVAAIGTAAVAAGKKLYDMANDAAATGDEIDKMSQKIGISAKAYQEWDYVFERSGTDVNNLQTGMKTLSSVITDAASGSETAAKKLSAVGLAVEDLNGLSQEQQLDLVISALQEMGSGAERTSAATDLLGKSATDMAAVLNMTADETRALKQEAEDYGMIMDDDAVSASAAFEDSLTKLQGTIGGLKNRMIGDLLPGITQIVDGLAGLVAGDEDAAEAIEDGITSIIKTISAMIPKAVKLIGTIAEDVLESAPSIISALAEGIIGAIPTLIPAVLPVVLQVITDLISTLLTLLPQIVTAIMDIVPQLIKQLIAAIPQLLQAAITFLMAIVDALPTIITDLIEALPEIIDTVIDALIEAIPMLIDAAIQLFMAIMEALPVIIEALTENLPEIIDTIIDGLLDALPLLLDGAIELMMAIVEAIPIIIPLLVEEIPGLVRSLIKALVDRLPDLIKGAVELLMGIIEAIPEIIVELGKEVPTIITAIVKGLKDGISDMAEVGLDLVKGLWNGIKDAGAWILEKIKGFAGDIVDGIKGFFGIASPSKVFRDQIGKNLALGMAEGIEDNVDAPLDAMSDLSDDLLGQAGELNGLTFERNLNTTFGGAQQAAEAQNGLLGKLDKILDAIEKGQFITLDGNLLVGGTLDLIDAKLGQRRIMAARGAL